MPVDLDALEKVLAEMTPGRWVLKLIEAGPEEAPDDIVYYEAGPDGVGCVQCATLEEDDEHNAAGVVTLRNEAPQLIARIRELDGEVGRLRKLFDDAGHGEHNVLALVENYQRNSMEADARLRAVRKLLEENGCDCPCDHHPDERGPDCDVCLACLIGEVVGN